MITFHIQPQIISCHTNHFMPFQLCPIGISLTYSVKIFCGVTFPANQKLVYVTLKCLNFHKRPISQLVLITDIFSYKTVKFGEYRNIINSFIDDFYRLYHTRKTANFQALIPLILKIALCCSKKSKWMKITMLFCFTSPVVLV